MEIAQNTVSATGNCPQPKRSQIAVYILGVFLIFAAGFFIFHGREARVTGNWSSIITSSDEYYYWAVAKGASQTPMSDENPYYYEDMGKHMSLPWTAAILTGKFAKWLHVPVMIFFPIWHIGMPFVLWLSMFLCFWKIWKYPASQSAAFSLFALLLTLFLRGQMQFLLFRFSRPGDGLWLLFILISLLMKPLSNKKTQLSVTSLLTFVLFWLQPFYLTIVAVIIFFEMIWQWLSQKDFRNLYFFLSTFISFCLAAGSYFLYSQTYSTKNSWLVGVITNQQEAHLVFSWIPFVVFLGVTALIAAKALISKKELTLLDRLMLCAFFLDPLFANMPLLFPKIEFAKEMGVHRYYFFLIQIACTTGWLAETLPSFFESRVFKKMEWLFVFTPLVFLGIFLGNRDTYFLRYATFINLLDDYMIYLDDSILLVAFFLAAFFCFWLRYRFKNLIKMVSQRKIAYSFFAVMSVCGFLFLPCHHTQWNQKNPFEGAYRWFRQNAKKYDVVMTVPPNRIPFDYLILNTDLKTYYSEAGPANFSESFSNKDYRRNFYQLLLLDWLQSYPLKGYATIEQKLRHFKLDYILINKPSPFLQSIEKQLDGYLEKVYDDERSLIWKVKLTKK